MSFMPESGVGEVGVLVFQHWLLLLLPGLAVLAQQQLHRGRQHGGEGEAGLGPGAAATNIMTQINNAGDYLAVSWQVLPRLSCCWDWERSGLASGSVSSGPVGGRSGGEVICAVPIHREMPCRASRADTYVVTFREVDLYLFLRPVLRGGIVVAVEDALLQRRFLGYLGREHLRLQFTVESSQKSH